MKRALVFLLALLVTPILAGVAGAHVEVTPSKAPAGKAVNLALSVGHGCEGAPTNRLEVLMPPEVRSVRPGKVNGWAAKSPEGRLVWTGGPLPDHDVKQFPFEAVLYGTKGETLTFKIIQGCEGGAETAWIQTAAAGKKEPTNPASELTLTSTAVAPVENTESELEDSTGSTGGTATADERASASDKDDEDDGGSSILLPIIGVILVAGSVTAFVVIQRGKRQN